MISKENFNLKAAILFVALLFSIFYLDFRFKKLSENNLVNDYTSVQTAKSDDGSLIHSISTKNFDKIIQDWRNRGSKPIILKIGNSQYHTINQKVKNQKVVSEILFNYYQNLGYEYLTISLPNLNFQEALFIYLYFKSLPIEILLLPTFFDDTRENGIRKNLLEKIRTSDIVLPQDDLTVRKYSQLLIRDESFVEKVNIQEFTEKKIDSVFSSILPVWGARSLLRSDLFYDMYSFRNKVFGIDAKSKRKKLNAPYSANINALLSINKIQKNSNNKILLFIPPIRSDIEIPYIIEEYEDFKNHIKNICYSEDILFSNLENVVNNDFWGYQRSIAGNMIEVDFMHFTHDGHKLLAKSLIKQINPHLIK